jgi:purine-nucleoside phosphorylase
MRRIESALASVRDLTRIRPRAALVLGPGVEALADGVSVEAELPYAHLLERHEGSPAGGCLRVGRLGEVPVAAMRGVLLRHEGHALADLALPVRVMRLLAGDGPPPPLLVAGTCTSLEPLSEPEELVLVDDHINLMGENPLAGPNLDALGPRFPDMSEPYDRKAQRVALECALERRIPLRRGVYVAVAGPQLPTRAETRMYRWLGGDFIGSWLVPEVIVARHMGMRVLALLAPEGVPPPPRVQAAASAVSGDVQARVAATLKDVLGRLAAPGA